MTNPSDSVLRWYRLLNRAGVSVFVAVLAICTVVNSSFAQEQGAQTTETTADPTPQYPPITLSDGTAIHLRFAQPVYGLAVASFCDCAVRKGSTVRMVVGADVRLGHRIVIAKGAPAEATVARVWRPRNNAMFHQYDPVITGLSLKLDWAKAVTGEHVRVRASQNGHSKPFDVEVVSAKGGIQVSAIRLSRAILGPSLYDVFSGRVAHKKLWIPYGARMVAFVDGDFKFERAALEQAQSEFPVPNLSATLYLFRTKDKQPVSPDIACDESKIGSLAQRQMVVTDFPPGKHSCHVGTASVELTLEAGSEYYLWLRQAGDKKWELKQVSTEEGEDRSADAEMLPPKAEVKGQQEQEQAQP